MSDDEKTSQKPSLHPVYTVHNIQNKVRILDGTKVTYASWVRLFKLHARAYKVLHHIDGTAAPAKTDPDYEEWCEIDSHVLQWIYSTLSDDLLTRILDADSTAYTAWTKVQNIFLNNKGARAASLEHEFTNLKLAAMPSLDAYCQRLRDLASQLHDVDATVTDQRLVLQLVRGLTPPYDTVAAYINQTLPSFETARSMIELENHRQLSREEPPSALVVPPSLPPDSNHPWPAAPQARVSTPPQRPTPQNRRNHGRRDPNHGRRGHNHRSPRGRFSPSLSSSTASPDWVSQPPWVANWAPPPCPYPTYPGWADPWPSSPAPFRPPPAVAATGINTLVVKPTPPANVSINPLI
ncbi:hypothetical protein vseg_011979 [Gypsophila vaccaria]